jgi:hypothetical protein
LILDVVVEAGNPADAERFLAIIELRSPVAACRRDTSPPKAVMPARTISQRPRPIWGVGRADPGWGFSIGLDRAELPACRYVFWLASFEGGLPTNDQASFGEAVTSPAFARWRPLSNEHSAVLGAVEDASRRLRRCRKRHPRPRLRAALRR